MMLVPFLLRVAAFAVVGFALGALHFAGLRVNAGLYLAPGRRARALGLHALRMAVLVAVWLAIARFGALALVAAFAGLLAARWTTAGRVERRA